MIGAMSYGVGVRSVGQCRPKRCHARADSPESMMLVTLMMMWMGMVHLVVSAEGIHSSFVGPHVDVDIGRT